MESSIPEMLHERIQEAIFAEEEEPGILTGWVISFEIVDGNGKPFAGYFTGPSTPPWKALGLLDWAKRLLDLKHIKDDD